MTNKILRFQAELKPNSYDAETRTGEAVIATDRVIEGVRIDFAEFFSGGLPKALPLQPDHVNSVLQKRGEWHDLRIESGKDGIKRLVGRFTLSKRADNEPLHTMLVEGMLRHISVGFAVRKWRTETDATTGKKTRVAVQGNLIEASFVNNPADELAEVRGASMPENNTTPAPAETQVETATVERMSAEQFDTVCRAAGVADNIREALRQSPADDTERMRLALASVERSQPTVRTVRSHNDATLDNPAVLRNAVIEFYDTVNRGEAPTGAAAEVFAQGERALAERLCRNAGINTLGLSDAEVMRRAATTSDFPVIAGGTFNLAMRREMEAAAAPIAGLFGRDTVSSFNAETRAQADWTTLAIADRLENGHYKHSFVHESGETVSVAVIGGITSKSYELTINAGSRLGNDGVQFGKRMAAEIADRQVAFVEQASHAGPTMSDGKAVFDASRNNAKTFTLDGSTEISQLMALRSDMAKRKGAGDVMIGVYPTHWLVHSDFEEAALKLLAAVQASAVADVNPLAGKLQVVVEPRLSDPNKSWLIADPAKMGGAVRVFLSGQEAPFTDSRINFETDALQFKIRQAFGLGWLEWRSWTRLDHTAA